MATFEKSFLTSEYPGKRDDRDLAAAIGMAEGAIAVVRYRMTPGGDVLFGTCESKEKINDYLGLHEASVIWDRSV